MFDDAPIDTLWMIAIVAAAGMAPTLVVGLVARAASVVPQEDRRYRDTPPSLMRWVWRPIGWIAFYVGPLLSERRRERLSARLRAGGFEFSVTPAQFVAARILSASTVALLALWILSVFSQAWIDAVEPPSIVEMLSATATMIATGAGGALLGWGWPALWLRDRVVLRRRELLKAIPFFLDMVTLCVEAGLNVQGALTQVATKGPPGVLREEVQRLLRDVRAGKPRAEALRQMAERLAEPGVRSFAQAVVQAEALGANLGVVLRQQAEQRRVERFLRAEKLAMEAPVKLLFPLLACIFPCTFIVLAFPIVVKFLAAGW